MEAIQVVTEVQRRRRFSVEQKIRCVQESNLPGMWSCPYKTGHSAFATSRINSLGDFSLNPLWG